MTEQTSGTPTGRLTERLTGVDAARGAALVGMTAVHVLAEGSAAGDVAHAVAAGRSAALFAVLAGVGIALARPGWPPLVVRGLLVGAVGLLLGALDTGVAVILAYYAVLFLLAVPLRRLGPRVLLPLGAVLAVAVPVVSQVVRPGLDPGLRASPTFPTLLEQPRALAETLLLTGYYPALAWTAYLCAGLGVGRLALRSRRVQVSLVAGGAALASAATAVSQVLLRTRGHDAIGRPPDEVQEGRFGTVPTDTWWWLATDAPHSTTPLDLLHTTGTALAVLGAALLAQRGLGWLAAAGSMPLTLYSAHVVLLAVVDSRSATFWLTQAVVGLVVAMVWRRRFRRGPLEALVAAVTRRLPT